MRRMEATGGCGGEIDAGNIIKPFHEASVKKMGGEVNKYVFAKDIFRGARGGGRRCVDSVEGNACSIPEAL